ncbi:MAG: ABC-type transport auxiliary lipoprotein family protein [Candidatus Binatia bacterium]
MTKTWMLLAASLLAGGCLLPSPPEPPRLFAPLVSDAVARPVETTDATAVRVAPVRSPLYLREQMAWRLSEVEIGLYDQRRWTELPSTYVERSLGRELGGLEHPRTLTDVPVVSAEVRAFEEVLAPVHEARVEVAIEVADARCVLLQQGFAATRPLAGDDPAAVARGIGEALDEVTTAAGKEIRRALEHRGHCTDDGSRPSGRAKAP